MTNEPENKYTPQQVAEMFEDIEYNERMQAMRGRMDKYKKLFNDLTLVENFFVLTLELYNMLAATDKLFGTAGALLLLAVVPLSFVVYSKREPYVFLIIAVLYLLLIPLGKEKNVAFICLIFAAVNIIFHVISRGILRLKEEEGYPAFAPRSVRNKYM